LIENGKILLELKEESSKHGPNLSEKCGEEIPKLLDLIFLREF
jgi:hypothetical protein